MEKEEKKIVNPVVDTVDNNEPVVEPTQDENPEENVTVDDNTEVDPVAEPVVTEEPIDVPTVEVPMDPVTEPVEDAPVEDPTLATTDEIIPAPVDIPGEEPVAIDPVEPVIDPVTVDPVVTDPVEPVVDTVVDIDNPPVDTVIPEDPAALAPAEPVDAPVEVPEAGCPCGDPNCDGTCGIAEPCGEECPNCSPVSNVTVANLFGTLQECVTIAWRFHLKTRKHHVHVVLNEFYEKALDIVDDIIEQYQGIVGVVEDTFTNCVVGDGKSEGEYLTELKAFVENNRCVIGGHSEIDSVVDEFLGLIDSTLYKLTSFTENAIKSFEEFVYEDYTANESCKYNRFGDRSSDDPDDDDYDPEFDNGECGGEEEE